LHQAAVLSQASVLIQSRFERAWLQPRRKRSKRNGL
jgi:hypothetical protein